MDNGLPKLIGTDKQNKWAEEIRLQALNSRFNAIPEKGKLSLDQDAQSQIELFEVVQDARQKLFTHKQSEWWIKYRDYIQCYVAAEWTSKRGCLDLPIDINDSILRCSGFNEHRKNTVRSIYRLISFSNFVPYKKLLSLGIDDEDILDTLEYLYDLDLVKQTQPPNRLQSTDQYYRLTRFEDYLNWLANYSQETPPSIEQKKETENQFTLVPPGINVEIKESQVRTITPYNSVYVAQAKKLGGKWNGLEWTFPLAKEAEVRKILTEVYGTDGTMFVPLRSIQVDLSKVNCQVQTLQFGGRTIAHRGGRDNKVKIGENCSVINGVFQSSGGSGKYPIIEQNNVIIEIRDCAQAVIDFLNINKIEYKEQ
ncbi:hypothetical protein [Leptospira interrogans]|uniref:hypothetical protein n=1 Tax=Leptospira interrogans TaxID=173 RepID=UPI0002E0C78A|nr:hypothetical protein [Leptospira interrogans]QOI36765.1 hypothetical protein LeptoLang_21480 [Leptospira interrogans serovar Icterohaemorrhagiae]